MERIRNYCLIFLDFLSILFVFFPFFFHGHNGLSVGVQRDDILVKCNKVKVSSFQSFSQCCMVCMCQRHAIRSCVRCAWKAVGDVCVSLSSGPVIWMCWFIERSSHWSTQSSFVKLRRGIVYDTNWCDVRQGQKEIHMDMIRPAKPLSDPPKRSPEQTMVRTRWLICSHTIYPRLFFYLRGRFEL